MIEVVAQEEAALAVATVVGEKWTHASVPVGNPHDPPYGADKGYASDAVHLRVKADRINRITAWHGITPARKSRRCKLPNGRGSTEPFGGGSLQLFRTEG